MKPDDVTLQVIRASELEPGDMVIIKAPQELLQAAMDWASGYFKGRHVRIGGLLTSMEVQIIREKKDDNRGQDSTTF